MILLVDFDGTIHDLENRGDRRMGPPMPGALVALRYLVSLGHHITVFTGRPVDDQRQYLVVKDWLDHYQVPYDDITNVKPMRYDLIVDNRALHFDEWAKVLPKLLQLDDKENRKKFAGESHHTN